MSFILFRLVGILRPLVRLVVDARSIALTAWSENRAVAP
jgi:hypothetical protein